MRRRHGGEGTQLEMYGGGRIALALDIEWSLWVPDPATPASADVLLATLRAAPRHDRPMIHPATTPGSTALLWAPETHVEAGRWLIRALGYDVLGDRVTVRTIGNGVSTGLDRGAVEREHLVGGHRGPPGTEPPEALWTGAAIWCGEAWTRGRRREVAEWAEIAALVPGPGLAVFSPGRGPGPPGWERHELRDPAAAPRSHGDRT